MLDNTTVFYDHIRGIRQKDPPFKMGKPKFWVKGCSRNEKTPLQNSKNELKGCRSKNVEYTILVLQSLPTKRVFEYSSTSYS